jgi:hypothetical protein
METCWQWSGRAWQTSCSASRKRACVGMPWRVERSGGAEGEEKRLVRRGDWGLGSGTARIVIRGEVGSGEDRGWVGGRGEANKS